MPLLPPLGAEIPCSTLADAKLEYAGRTLALSFRGGIKQRIDVNPENPEKSVRLRVVGFKMSADTESMTVTLEQNDVDVDAPSSLRITQQSPPQFEQIDVLPFTATIEQTDGGAPVVLTAKKPMILIGQTTQFPPHGQLYQLGYPVELVAPEDPGTAVGRITAFNCKKGGL
ncbi:hypothetical protein ACH49O_41425 [Streptomyces coeruleorubidus]|uniref:hypothetical protein n=1 Tax=Streptomyces coeruleorubidus TaxID=116188 RepID=UPI0033EE7474